MVLTGWPNFNHDRGPLVIFLSGGGGNATAYRRLFCAFCCGNDGNLQRRYMDSVPANIV